LKLDDAASVLRRVNRAMENINAYLSHHMDDEEGAKKREHPRFAKKDMQAKFVFWEHPRYRDRVFESRLHDISVGGMNIEMNHDLKVQLRDQIKFSVHQGGGKKAVVKGVGKVVRIRDHKEFKRVGIQFLGVSQS
jgi:hypothetical protein